MNRRQPTISDANTVWHGGPGVKGIPPRKVGTLAKSLTGADIRSRFFELCRRLGWRSAAEVARKLEADPGDVSKWEAGKRPVPERHQAYVADRAGEGMEYFAPRPDAELVRVDRRDKLVIATWLEEVAARLRAEALGEASPPEGADVAEGYETLSQVAEALGTAARPKAGRPKRARRPG